MVTIKRDNYESVTIKRNNNESVTFPDLFFVINNSSSPNFSMKLKDSVRYCGWRVRGESCEQ